MLCVEITAYIIIFIIKTLIFLSPLPQSVALINQKTVFIGIFLHDGIFLEFISSPAWSSRCFPGLDRARTLSLGDLLETTQCVRDTCRCKAECPLLSPLDTDPRWSQKPLGTSACNTLVYLPLCQADRSRDRWVLWVKCLLHWVGNIHPHGHSSQLLDLLTCLIWKPLISWFFAAHTEDLLWSCSAVSATEPNSFATLLLMTH